MTGTTESCGRPTRRRAARSSISAPSRRRALLCKSPTPGSSRRNGTPRATASSWRPSTAWPGRSRRSEGMPPVFIITIDTEGDNIWAHPNPVTTENARHLPRFQELCEKYGFAPTYLVDYEMAIDRDFQRLGRDAIRRRTGEIGLHIHPWYSPPPAPESTDPRRDHIYLFELPDDALHAKIHDLTKILQDTFEIQPTSHRAGRWG